MEIVKDGLILTTDERKTLAQASAILKAIADNMDGSWLTVSRAVYHDDEIYGACEIINDIIGE